MTPVTVYNVTSAQTIREGRNDIPVYKFNSHESFISCKDGSLIQKTIEIEYWPIEYYQFSNGRELYAAIDPVLREALDIEIENIQKLKWERSKLLKDLLEANKKVENLQHDLESCMTVVNEYVNMSLWQKIKFLFKGH